MEEEAIAAHGIDDAGAHQVQGVDGAKEGDDHDGAKDEIAVAAEDALGGQAEGKIVAGDLVHRKNIEDGGVDEQVDDEERAEAGEDGPGDEITGIFHFVAEVDGAVPAVVGEDGGLHAEKHRGDECCSCRDGNCRRCENFRVGAAAQGEARDDHDQENQSFQDGGEVLNFAAHGYTFPLQQRENYDYRDAGDFDAQHAVEHREEMRQIFAEDDADGAGGAAGGDPIAPADDEAGVFAESAAREIILAAAGRNQGAEFRELEGAEEGVKGAADPDSDEEPCVGKDCGDAAGSANDADRDGIADGDRDAEADAEDLQEFPFVFAIGRVGWELGDVRR